MKFDWSSCAVGMIASAGVILCIIFAAQLDIFVDTPVCAGDENGLTCARNWANGIAITAAAGTIFFLAREQSTARKNRQEDREQALELYTLQTLPMRAKLARLTYLVDAMERERVAIHQAATGRSEPISTSRRKWKPRRQYPYAIRRLYVLAKREDWEDVQDIDGSIGHYRRDLVTTIEIAVDEYLRPGVTMEEFATTDKVMDLLDLSEGLMENDPYSEEVASRTHRLLSQVEALKIAIELGVLREHFASKS